MAGENQTLAFQGADASKINFLNKETPAEENTGAAATNTSTENPESKEGATTTETTAATQGTTTTQQQGAAAAAENTQNQGEANTGAAVSQQNTPEGEYTEEQFHEDVNTFISEQTGGAVKSFTQVASVLEENKKLKAELQAGYKFPNDAAKQVYELATKVQGSELSTARKLLHVLSLDPSTMTPKEKQLEAFILDRPNLSREDARKRFDAMYERKYSDLENDLIQIDEHDVATRDAETKLSAHLGVLEKAVKQGGETTQEGPSLEAVQQWHSRLESALGQFGGVTLKFDDGQYGKLNVSMDRSKASEFMEVLKNPHTLIDQIAATCQDENDFIREMYMLFDRSRISKEERDHLMKLGKVTQMQENKNTQKKDLKEESTTQTKPTYKDAFVGAMKAAGMA